MGNLALESRNLTNQYTHILIFPAYAGVFQRFPTAIAHPPSSFHTLVSLSTTWFHVVLRLPLPPTPSTSYDIYVFLHPVTMTILSITHIPAISNSSASQRQTNQYTLYYSTQILSFQGCVCHLLNLQLISNPRCGIALDAWMFPLGDELYHHTINQPLLFINTETFHWRKNIKQIMELLKHDTGTWCFLILLFLIIILFIFLLGCHACSLMLRLLFSFL